MRSYEILYVIRPDIEEEAKSALVKRFDEVLTNNGAEIVESKEWGKRRLAYEIEDFKDGYYQIIKFNGDSAASMVYAWRRSTMTLSVISLFVTNKLKKKNKLNIEWS